VVIILENLFNFPVGHQRLETTFTPDGYSNTFAFPQYSFRSAFFESVIRLFYASFLLSPPPPTSCILAIIKNENIRAISSLATEQADSSFPWPTWYALARTFPNA